MLCIMPTRLWIRTLQRMRSKRWYFVRGDCSQSRNRQYQAIPSNTGQFDEECLPFFLRRRHCPFWGCTDVNLTMTASDEVLLHMGRFHLQGGFKAGILCKVAACRQYQVSDLCKPARERLANIYFHTHCTRKCTRGSINYKYKGEHCVQGRAPSPVCFSE